ncbi:MAG: DUF2723 domain-containing protein [Elusimicrobiota bacterium]
MAIIISLIAFGIYLLGLAPTISAGDSGELVSAAANLGIAHPSGYPLYCLIGKIFSFVFPLAAPAYRINLVSAFFSAVTAGVSYKIIEGYFSTRKTSWLPAGLALGVVLLPVFWSQAVVAEVFSLNIFFAALLIWLAAKLEEDKYFILFSFIAGLGLGNHQTIALVGLGLLLPQLVRLISRKKLLFFCFVFFLLGYSVNFYLLVRAAQHPLVNWSDPSVWERFFRVVTRADYGTFRLHQEIQAQAGWGVIFAQLKHFFSYLIFVPFGRFGWLGVLLAGVGIFKRKSTKSEWFAFLLAGPLFVLLSRLPMDAWSMAVISRFYLPAALIYYLWIIKGTISLMRISDCGLRNEQKELKNVLNPQSAIRNPQLSTHITKAMVSIIVLAVPVYLTSYNLSKESQRQNFFVYDYGKNILRTLAKNSTLFIEKVQDDAVFSLIYLRYLERRRPDCRFYESEVRVFPVIYGPDYAGLNPLQRLARRGQIQEQLIRQEKNPVYFLATSRDDLKRFVLYRQGLLSRAYEKPVSPASAKPSDIFWEIYNCRGVGFSEAVPSLDYRTRSLIVSYPLERADYYRLSGKKDLAINDGELVEKIADDLDWAQNNLGNFYRLIGNPEKAQQQLARAISQKPNYDIAWYNLGLVYETEKNWAKAFESYQKAWQIVPQDQDVLSRLELSALYWAYQLSADNQKEQALQLYDFVKTINPNQPVSYYNSAALYEQLGNRRKSQEELKKYRQLTAKKPQKS